MPGPIYSPAHGDDHWASPHKLQKQADLLDSNRGVSACFHGVDRVWTGGSQKRELLVPGRKRPQYCFSDLSLVAGQMEPSSVMFRNRVFGDFHNWFYQLAVGDLPLYVLLARQGDFGYIDEVMTIKTIHPGGVWHRCRVDRRREQLALIEFYGELTKYLSAEEVKDFRRRIHRYYCNLAFFLADAGSSG